MDQQEHADQVTALAPLTDATLEKIVRGAVTGLMGKPGFPQRSVVGDYLTRSLRQAVLKAARVGAEDLRRQRDELLEACEAMLPDYEHLALGHADPENPNNAERRRLVAKVRKAIAGAKPT